MSENPSQTFKMLIPAPVEQVYTAFTNASALREWLSDVATTLPQPGGRIYLAWNSGYYMSGEYLTLEPNREIHFIWHGRGYPADTKVRVHLQPVAKGTQLELSQEGAGPGDAWDKIRQDIQEGWETSLENLVSVLGTGEDLRLTGRPMLGITISDFSPEIALQMGVPVSTGLRLDLTIEGMGAYAAGLRSNDVIVAMDGKPVSDYPSLSNILSRHRGGDRVEVEYYRGPENLSTIMELSKRPLPELPATPAALAKIQEERLDEQTQGLAQLFSRVTEEQASFKPKPGEWSAKEILAHLILNERGLFDYILDVVVLQERWADDFGGNPPVAQTAILEAFPTIPELLEELQRNGKEVVALIAGLPPEFVARKGSWWRLAYGIVEAPYHYLQHKEQIEAALQAGRN